MYLMFFQKFVDEIFFLKCEFSIVSGQIKKIHFQIVFKILNNIFPLY